MREKQIDKLKDYKYGFTTDIENIRAPKGLNKEVIEFISKAKSCGVDGIIVPDLPLEESLILLEKCSSNDINLIYLIAPTTSTERIKEICKNIL